MLVCPRRGPLREKAVQRTLHSSGDIEKGLGLPVNPLRPNTLSIPAEFLFLFGQSGNESEVKLQNLFLGTLLTPFPLLQDSPRIPGAHIRFDLPPLPPEADQGEQPLLSQLSPVLGPRTPTHYPVPLPKIRLDSLQAVTYAILPLRYPFSNPILQRRLQSPRPSSGGNYLASTLWGDLGPHSLLQAALDDNATNLGGDFDGGLSDGSNGETLSSKSKRLVRINVSRLFFGNFFAQVGPLELSVNAVSCTSVWGGSGAVGTKQFCAGKSGGQGRSVPGVCHREKLTPLPTHRN